MVSGHFPSSSCLTKPGCLPTKKKNNFLEEIYYQCVLKPTGKLLTMVLLNHHCLLVHSIIVFIRFPFLQAGTKFIPDVTPPVSEIHLG